MLAARLALQARSAGVVAFLIWLIRNSSLSQSIAFVSTFVVPCSHLIWLRARAQITL